MNSCSNQIVKSVAIIGGGTAGWIAAAELCHHLKDKYDSVTVIESSKIGTISVGEATIPAFVDFLRNLNINEREFIASVNGSFKLGIQFENWASVGEKYFHHFGALGVPIDGKDFFHYWTKAHILGDDQDLMSFSPAAAMARNGKFYLPFKLKESPLSRAAYALHLDAGLTANYLKSYAVERQVTHIDDEVKVVKQNGHGEIKSVLLSSGVEIEADFFIDCTGFRGLLINQTLQQEFISYGNYLLCDKAVTIQTDSCKSFTPYTRSTAHAAGWMWEIPLQHRTGNGYVYSSKYISDEQAEKTLLSNVSKEISSDSRFITFTPGKRRKVWSKNCLALGLSSGFLEPLESTSIHLVNRGIQAFIDARPDLGYTHETQNTYNAIIDRDYEEIRDFLILHYCLTKRTDSQFWLDCSNMELPKSLSNRLKEFKRTGDFANRNHELFVKPSWWAVLNGMGVIPSQYPDFVDSVNYNELLQSLKIGRTFIQQETQSLPSHRAFVTQFCTSIDNSSVRGLS